MSTYSYPKPGLGNAASFQSSGIPWTSSSVAPASGSSTEVFTFPQVTKFIVVKNVNDTDTLLRVGFSENGVVNSGNYFLLSRGESFAGDLKVTELHFMSDGASPVSFSAVVGLTTIDRVELLNSWSGSVGVG